MGPYADQDLRRTPETEKRYSPAECIGAKKDGNRGNPDPTLSARAIPSTLISACEHSFGASAQLALGISKKFENHCHGVALYAVWYNFVKMHKTLKMTPAMAAGASDKLWSVGHIADLIEAREAVEDGSLLVG